MTNKTSEFIVKESAEDLTALSGDEMALSEHIEEFSQRLIFCLICLILATLFLFLIISFSGIKFQIIHTSH